MAWATQAKLVIGYDNAVTPDKITAITVTNIVPDSGFSQDNLKYPDPGLKMRTSATSANDRIITIQFSSSQTFSCAGVLAHDLISRGYDFVNVEHSANGTSWTPVGTGTTALATEGNPNFLLRFSSAANTWWRFTFGKSSGTRPVFEVGMLFLGRIHEFGRHVVKDGGFTIIRDPGIGFVEAAGMDTWITQGAVRFDDEAEAELQQVLAADAAVFVNRIFETNLRKIICLLSPEHVVAQMPIVGQHLFGYLLPTSHAVRNGWGSGDKYDLTINLRGAA